MAVLHQVNWSESAGGVEIKGERFTLHQSHWHTLAEHTVDGKRYNLKPLFSIPATLIYIIAT